MDRRRVLRGPPIGRHLAAVGLLVVLMLLFVWVGIPRDRDGAPYVSHTLLADTSLVLLCFVLMLGPIARFVPRLRPVVPWGRELGIAMFVTAGLHVALLLQPDFDVVVFFGIRNFRGETEFGLRMWDASNWVGALALAYALVLVATSNDLSQRWLGSGWKFIQRQAYTLFVLAWLHTAAFVLLDTGHGSSFSTWYRDSSVRDTRKYRASRGPRCSTTHPPSVSARSLSAGRQPATG
jgi:DMSO/TMAO reductase YedYZ heme-binding membrane subunit